MAFLQLFRRRCNAPRARTRSVWLDISKVWSESASAVSTSRKVHPEPVATVSTSRKVRPEPVATVSTSRKVRPEPVATVSTSRKACPEPVTDFSMSRIPVSAFSSSFTHAHTRIYHPIQILSLFLFLFLISLSVKKECASLSRCLGRCLDRCLGRRGREVGGRVCYIYLRVCVSKAPLLAIFCRNIEKSARKIWNFCKKTLTLHPKNEHYEYTIR